MDEEVGCELLPNEPPKAPCGLFSGSFTSAVAPADGNISETPEAYMNDKRYVRTLHRQTARDVSIHDTGILMQQSLRP
jgi:hypothetical protein